MVWKNPDLDEFGKGDLFILSEDGDKGVVVPIGEPEIIRDTFKGKTRKQAEVPVFDIEADCIRFWRQGSRVWRKFVRLNPKGENDCKVILTVTRHGKPDDTATTYDLQRTGDVVAESELSMKVEKAFLDLPNERAKRDR